MTLTALAIKMQYVIKKTKMLSLKIVRFIFSSLCYKTRGKYD